jgi:hypothetical protein
MPLLDLHNSGAELAFFEAARDGAAGGVFDALVYLVYHVKYLMIFPTSNAGFANGPDCTSRRSTCFDD